MTEAEAFLIEKFRERLEWPSFELRVAAMARGIPFGRLIDAKWSLGFPEARLRVLDGEQARWTWWVPADHAIFEKED